MNSENKDLTYYLYNWYNFYKKCREVSVVEDNYINDSKNPTISIDSSSRSFKSLNIEAKKEEAKCGYIYSNTSQLYLKMKWFVERRRKLREKEYKTEEFEDLKQKVKEKQNAAKKRMEVKYNVFFISKIILAVLTVLFVITAVIGSIMKNSTGKILMICSIVLSILFGITTILLLILSEAIKRNIKMAYDDYWLKKQNELVNITDNYKKDAISKYFDLVTEYNQAVLRKNTNLKIYTDLVNKFNSDEIIKAVKENIEQYNDSELARYGENLIIECNKFAPSYERYVITVEQKAKEYVKELHKLFDNLNEVRTMLRTNYPLPEKYENEDAVSCLLSLALDGRCDTLKEAINLLEDEKYKAQLLNSIRYLATKIEQQNYILATGFQTLIKQNSQLNEKITQIRNISFYDYINR